MGLTGRQEAGIGLGALGLLPSLFGGDHGLSSAIGDLKTQEQKSSALGDTFTAQGQDLFGPVANYLKGVLGNKASLDYATLPERTRVIDQYATAKKALAQFTPRGGGLASAGANLQGKEASDLANVEATARREGFSSAEQLASHLSQLGVNEQQLASGDLNSIINGITGENTASAANASGIGSALGTIAGFLFL